MKTNKYGMNAGSVKLDLDALIKQAGNAIKNAQSAMNRAQSEIDSALYTGKNEQEIYHANRHRQFYAKVLAEAAQEYAEAWQAYYYLCECRVRESVTLIRDDYPGMSTKQITE